MRVVEKIISLLEKRYFSASEILLNALDEHNFEKAASIIDGHPSILNNSERIPHPWREPGWGQANGACYSALLFFRACSSVPCACT